MDFKKNIQHLTVFSLILAALASFYQAICYLVRLDKKDFILAVFSKFSVRLLNSVATILPIKIILFLAPGQNMPTMLQSWFKTQTQFVLFLCVLTIVFFILAKVFEKVVELVVKKKVYKILVTGDGLSKRQKKQVKQVVNKCITAVAAGLFALCLMCVVGWLYLELLFVFWVCFILISTAFNFIIRVLDLKRIKYESVKLINMGAELCFYGVFFYIVYMSLVLGIDQSFVVVVVSLILMRQSSVAIGRVSCALAGIYNQRAVFLR
jgi:hypothetical protein